MIARKRTAALLALLATALLACRKEPIHVRTMEVEAVLPLTGALSPDGLAFRDGLQEGLSSSFECDDSLQARLKILDNASSPDSSAALLAHLDSGTVCAVAGIGFAVEGLAAPQGALGLWAGTGDLPDSSWRRVTPAPQAVARGLLPWCRRAPKPLAILFPASAAWAPMVQEHLAAMVGTDSVILVPHDVGESQWAREAARLLERSPKAALLWDTPEEARSLLARPDLQELWRKIPVLGPQGSGTPSAWALAWEPSPAPEEYERKRWRELGARLGRSIAAFLKTGKEPAAGWTGELAIED
jgi:hypothetical protein